MTRLSARCVPARVSLVYLGCVLAACGGSPTSPPPGSATITVTATGVSPVEVRIPAGGTVTFRNSDVRPHAVSSDPIQTHTQCPAINDVGTLAPGQSRTTAPLTVVRVCGFHDHNDETNPAYYGRIIVE